MKEICTIAIGILACAGTIMAMGAIIGLFIRAVRFVAGF